MRILEAAAFALRDLLFFAVCAGAVSGDLFKCLGKGINTGIAAGIGNVFYGKRGIHEEFRGLGHAEAHQKLLGRHMHRFRKQLGKVAPVQRKVIGNILNLNGILVILMDVGNGLVDVQVAVVLLLVIREAGSIDQIGQQLQQDALDVDFVAAA